MNPFIKLEFKSLHKNCYVNLLLDTGSQISIIDYDLVKDLNLPCVSSTKKLKTINSSQNENGYLCKPTVTFHDNDIAAEFFALPDLAFCVDLPEYNKINCLTSNSNFNLSSHFPYYEKETLKISGILGVDNLHLLNSFKVVHSGKINFIKLGDGVIPFGNMKFHSKSLHKSERSGKSENRKVGSKSLENENLEKLAFIA